MPSATTQVCSAKCTLSTINTTRSSLDRSAAINSVSACSVAATNRRETTDRLVDEASAATFSPTGSRPWP